MAVDNYTAIIPIDAFNYPIPIPSTQPDSPAGQVAVFLDEMWIAPLLGASVALLAQSTWKSTDATALDNVRQSAEKLIKQIASYRKVSDLIEFRNKPSDPILWQYSTDAGVTWTDGPNTAQYFTPDFIVNAGVASGYDLTVNGSKSVSVIPQMDNIVDNAVRNNPSSSLVNTIASTIGVTPLDLISGGSVALLIESQENAIEIGRKAGFDVSLSETFLQITKSVADAGNVLVTVIVP